MSPPGRHRPCGHCGISSSSGAEARGSHCTLVAEPFVVGCGGCRDEESSKKVAQSAGKEEPT